MSVAIRLARHGSKKNAFFRIVVANSRSRRDGRFIEQIGVYDPRKSEPAMEVDRRRLEKWLSEGARPSDTVRTLLRKLPAAETPGPEDSGAAA